MNAFQGVQSGKGLLKNYYDEGSDKVSEALKRLRKKRRAQSGMKLEESDQALEDESQ